MLRLLSALTTIAALALASTTVAAKDRPGTLDAITGIFAESPALCRTYWRNMGPNLEIGLSKIKGKYYYHDCHGRSCEYQIVSHARDAAGLVLRLRYTVATGEPTVKLTVKRSGKDRFVFAKESKAPTTRIRCTDADIAAGIGVQSIDDEPLEPDFAVNYALGVPDACPGLAVDTKAAFDRIAGQNPTKVALVKETIEWDKKEIKDFCRKVLDAFGPKGRIIPGLLYPAGSKR